MNIEELQAAIRRWDLRGLMAMSEEQMDTIVKAARLWLNPNIEAASQAVAKHLHDMFPDISMPATSARIAKDAVAAGLTPQGDTEAESLKP